MSRIISNDKFSKPALYAEKEKNNAVKCRLCPHNCLIQVNHYGICKVRQNINGDLFTTAYGNPCSVSIDPIEKKPLYHFLPGTEIFSLATAGCNFHCLNCQNYTISQFAPEDLRHYNIPPENIVEQAIHLHQKSIAFTYTEPTVFYEYMLDIAKLARKEGLKTVMVTNGFINPEPLNELCSYLDAANIDLKSMDDNIYRKLTGGKLQPVLDTILALNERNVWVEITHLLIPGFTDNERNIDALCMWMLDNKLDDVPLHFSRFFPNYKLKNTPPTSLDSLLQAEKIASNAGIKHIYTGNISGLKSENTYCPNCGKLLIQRQGYKIAGNFIKNGKCPECDEKIAGIWE